MPILNDIKITDADMVNHIDPYTGLVNPRIKREAMEKRNEILRRSLLRLIAEARIANLRDFEINYILGASNAIINNWVKGKTDIPEKLNLRAFADMIQSRFADQGEEWSAD